MAEVENKSSALAIVPNPQGQAQSLDTFTITEYDPAGEKKSLIIPMPSSIDFAQWTVLQQVGMLKRGPWSKIMIADIYWGLSYAHRIGADVMKGDLFPTGEGRFGTSNKFKIKQGFATGRIESFEVDIRDTGERIELAGCIQKTDLECTVTLEVKGLKKPIIRKARLSRWFNAKNPNWQGRPEHMLELNTFAHACEYIPGNDGIPAALLTEEDEAPPVADAVVIEQPEPTPSMTTREVNAPASSIPQSMPRVVMESEPVSVKDIVADLKREVEAAKPPIRAAHCVRLLHSGSTLQAPAPDSVASDLGGSAQGSRGCPLPFARPLPRASGEGGESGGVHRAD